MTRLVRFANNATSKLAANISAVGLTVALTPGDGAKFPALSASQFFTGTMVKADGTKEVVKVTARSTDSLTVVRAFESVAGVQTAYAFTAGDKFELRLTAEAISNELDRLDAAAFLDVVNKSANYTIVEADVSKLIKTDTSGGAIVHTLPQISTLVGSFEVQISKNTGDGNTVTINRAGTDTINGLNSYALASQYQCVWLVADLSSGTWTAITSANASNKIPDAFIGAGTAGPFTLSGDPGSKNNTDVYVGGAYQHKASYTLAGTSLTLGGVVAVGVLIECNWAQPLPVGTPSDATVTTAKLADSVKTAIQSQTWTGFTSTGTAPAYILTPTPAIAAYAPGQRFRVASHAAGTTGSNTLNVSGQGVKNLKQYDATGAKVAAAIASGQLFDVEYDGLDFVVLNAIPPNAVLLTGNQTIAGVKTYASMPVLPTQSMVRVQSANGYGSTNTAIKRYTNVLTNQGVDITYADSITLGASFTINANGVYAMGICANGSATNTHGISLNSPQLTTNVASITAADRLALGYTAGGNSVTSTTTVYLASGSVIRPHADATGSSTPALEQFIIVRVG